MNVLPEVFTYQDRQVRTVTLDGEPYLIAVDVTQTLNYGGGARNAIARLPERMKGVAEINTPGGPQQMTVLNEAGVYRLVMRSNLPDAEAFQDWIAEEVLPALRQTGSYSMKREMPSHSEALRGWADEMDRREKAEAELEEAKPSAEAWDTLASAHGDYSVREASFVLNRDPGIDTGQRRLFAKLRELGLIDRRNIPYARHSDHATLRARFYTDPHTGAREATQQVRITHAGLKYLHRKLGGIAPLAAGQQLKLTDGDVA